MAIQAQFPSCGSQDWMEVGCGGFNHFYFNAQQQHKQQQHQQQQQQQQQWNLQPLENHNQQQQRNQNQNHIQNLCFDNSLPFSSSVKNNCFTTIPQSMALSQSMASYDDKQRQEIDHYVRLQNERFRLLLQEQRRQQVALLLKGVETKAVPLLRHKDEEIAQATKRSMELEDFLKKLEAENQAWQRLAQENEAMVISLSNTIEQLRENNASTCFNNFAEDAESCCEVETGDRDRGFADDSINEEEEKGRKAMTMVCRSCNTRNSCILFLPCRHLCSCEACEAFLDSCPVCQTAKKASIEALMV